MNEPREGPRGLLERLDRFFDTLIPPSDEVASHARRGEGLLAAGDPAGAQNQAETALETNPNYLRAHLLRADALGAQGRFGEALSSLSAQVKERVLPPSVYARLAEFAAGAGDEAEALRWETQARGRVRERDGEAGRRLLSAARRMAAQGNTGAAVRLARGATAVDPEQGEAWLLLAQDARRRGDEVQARRLLERVASSLPTTEVRANREAGSLALSLGEHKNAAQWLRRAWIGGDGGAVAQLVVALGRQGDEASLQRVIADASGADAQVARALLGLSHGDEAALAQLEKLPASELPEPLWPLALEAALSRAPLLAERWCREQPTRPGAPAVAALSRARERLEAGELKAAHEALAPALGEARTRSLALGLYALCLRARWAGQPALLLEELAVMVREAPASAALEGELRARRRELDEPLRVAILGEFSAGKSTFLNALVGAEVSPMGVLPTTAQVHWLRAGEAQARIVDGAGVAVLATVEEAPRVVERKREAGELIQYVEITLPLPRLARVELIDTPGFNAGDSDHEAAVRRAFSLADVALWLFDARQAGKLSETGPLGEAKERGIPVLGVLNKWDQVKPRERERLWKVLAQGMHELAPLACAVSAREALAAGLLAQREPASEQAREALERSGMPALLAYLDVHLVGQRTAWKALRVAAKARAQVAAALDALAAAQRGRAERAARRAELGTSLTALREKLTEVTAGVRSEVGAVLREQLKGLEGRREARAQLDAVAGDAAAELGYRARHRALEALAPQLTALERAAVEAGLLTREAARLATAPVLQLLDHAIAEGVRDALQGAPRALYAPGDPLAALERALTVWSDELVDDGGELRAALGVADELLSALPVPALEAGAPPAESAREQAGG